MTTIAEYFKQAELALAAYADLGIGSPPIAQLTDGAVGMSQAQAEIFAEQWTVVDQCTDPASGFSATVFERSGQRYLAIRGTQNGLDVVADIDLAFFNGIAARQTVALFNYVQRLNGVKGQSVAQLEWNGQSYVLNPAGAVGLLDVPLSGPITVAGHSLGGHLAMAFGRLFPQTTSAIYTYNAPGFVDAAASNFFARVDAALGRTGSQFQDAATTSLYGSGLTIIAGYADDHGSPQEILLESNTHRIAYLADSLAVYDLFSRVDGTLTIEAIGNILNRSSAQTATTLESAIQTLGRIFLATAPTIATDDRDSLYRAIQSVRQEIAGANYTLRLMGQDAAADAALARTDLATRYALRELNPFAVLGVDYSRFNANGELNLHDPVTGEGNLSDAWLTDRATMLAWANRARTEDTAFGSSQLYVDARVGETDGNVWDYTAHDRNQSVLVRSTDFLPDTHHVTFGSDADSFIVGGSVSDRLYGMAGNDDLRGQDGADHLEGGSGNDQLDGGAGLDELLGGAGDDTLTGGAGDDILEGGTGLDTYHADCGDTIRDADGRGTVFLGGTQLSFATRRAGESTWHDAAGNTYALTGGTLLVNDPLTIEGFDNGELGIYLDEEGDPGDPADPNDPTRRPGGPPAYNPNNASLVRRCDPLVLDLDGNGAIDAVGSTTSGIYFDFNGDGVSERAGWISSQDGLLALDANGNNVIDDLSELFGSNLQEGFVELAGHDGNADGRIDAQDADFAQLRVWQDANQDGISQTGELKTLDELDITSINLATTPANTAIADNLLTATGSFIRNGTEQLAGDIHLAVNFALTDSNPSRPLGQPPQLDAEVFNLPWLRGYGNVRSLHVAYQKDAGLRQAAAALQAQGWRYALGNFDRFMAQWTGLDAAHAAHGVTRTNLTTEDKAWMLENLTGQNVQKSAIEAANFGAISPGVGRLWNTAYVDSQWQSFVNREALSFALQVGTRDWLRGANYSLNLDRFIVTDSARLQQSLLEHLNGLTDKEEAAFAAIAVSRLRQDGVALNVTAIGQGISFQVANDSAWKVAA